MQLHIYPLSIEDSKRIGVVNKQFDADFPIKMKQIAGSLWTPEQKCWHIPYTKETWRTFEQLFEGHTIIREIKPTTQKVPYTERGTNEPVPKLDRTNNEQQQLLTEPMNPVSEMPTETRIIAQRCPDKPDRIFFSIPADRIDWKTYAHQVKDSQYHAVERLWSVPRTKELYKQFMDYFGESLFVDTQNPIVLTEVTTPIVPPQYPRIEDRITIFERYAEAQYWSIQLPKSLNKTYLGTIKNIEGRKWDDLRYVWEVPKTKTTVRFIDKYLKDVVHWACAIKADLPEQWAQTHVEKKVQQVSAKLESAQNLPAQSDTVLTAKQSFTTVNWKDFTAENTSDKSIEKPILIENKIIVRNAHFWRGRIRLDFYFRPDWVQKIKMMDSKRWHPEHQCWSLPHSPLVLDKLNKTFGEVLQYALETASETLPNVTIHQKPPENRQHNS